MNLLTLTFFGIGFLPITLLALHLFDILSLSTTTVSILLPGVFLLIAWHIANPKYIKTSLRGVAAGIFACCFYDITRVLMVQVGIWDDFVPRIGDAMMGSPHSNMAIGYLWRFIGNGGGMGLAFAYLPVGRTKFNGFLFGIFIWVCLLGTLLVSPGGQKMLFPLDGLTFFASLAGHIEYGCMLALALASPNFSLEYVLKPVRYCAGILISRGTLVTAKSVHPKLD